MTGEGSEERRREIEAAAFELLAEKGYRSTSMLQIAKRAAASNQTLYAWYGNKQTLFQSLIEDNARAVKAHLSEALIGQSDALAALRALGPLLLTYTTGAKAIIMNRAAIADATETGLLGAAIDTAARQEMIAMITGIMTQLVAAGRFGADTDPSVATETYVSLLFGEVPLQQAMGRLGPLDAATIAARSDRALNLTLRLFGTSGQI
ncbi:MAG: TetR/AcrR family transcriptional regulator [Sphingomonadales bacterium]|nr:TetR/AcrR family transcriptional regulator [Sphingomonadales bacterium]